MGIPAKHAKTIIVPIRTNVTLPCYDANRPSIGLHTHTTLWTAKTLLKIVIHNAASQPIMLGSRTILAGILIDSTCEFQTIDGHRQQYQLVLVDQSLDPEQSTHQTLVNLYPEVLADKVGCFKLDRVQYIHFLRPPASPRLEHIPLKGRYVQASMKQILSWEDQGIVKEVSWTPHIGSPLVITPKPHSHDFRVCLDFRYLNPCVRQVFAPALDRQAIITNLSKKLVYSTLDISSAFMCIEISQHLSTF